MLQARIGLVKLLQHFEFTTCTRTQIPLKYSPSKLVLSPENGLWLKINKLPWDNRQLNGCFQFGKINFMEKHKKKIVSKGVTWQSALMIFMIFSQYYLMNRCKEKEKKLKSSWLCWIVWSRVCRIFIYCFRRFFLPFFLLSKRLKWILV